MKPNKRIPALLFLLSFVLSLSLTGCDSLFRIKVSQSGGGEQENAAVQDESDSDAAPEAPASQDSAPETAPEASEGGGGAPEADSEASGMPEEVPAPQEGGETAEMVETVPVQDPAYKVALIAEGAQPVQTAAQEFCGQNGIEFQTYPAGARGEEVTAAVDAAAADGYHLILLSGPGSAAFLVEAANRYPEVKFVALDVTEADLLAAAGVDSGSAADYYSTENVVCLAFREELAGYLAGFAAVKLGNQALGYLGDSACDPYGAGFLQGCDDAAGWLEKGQYSVEYAWSDGASPASVEGWIREKGIQAVLVTERNLSAAVQAAGETGCQVIAAGVDGAALGMSVTASAVKGLDTAVTDILSEIVLEDGWASLAGTVRRLGVEDASGFLRLEGLRWEDSEAQAEYLQQVEALSRGEVSVSEAGTELPNTDIFFAQSGTLD